MKFCKDPEKCQTCDIRELCGAFEKLVDLVESYKPTPKLDDKIREDVEDYLTHMVLALDEDKARELYRSLDFKAFQGIIYASIQTVSDLYISWEAKCEEIDKLKVQLEAQEAICNG